MFRSSEARWFISGSLPDEVLRWFKAGQALDSEGVQVQEYLVFPDCQSVGVKLREGRFEIKAILAPLSRSAWTWASKGEPINGLNGPSQAKACKPWTRLCTNPGSG